MKGKRPLFQRIYDPDKITYKFVFFGTDERTMHEAIIMELQKSLKTLKLHGDSERGAEGATKNRGER